MFLLEIFFSIHILLFITSFFIGGKWLQHNPSLKLKLLRILLASCVLSPILVHSIVPEKNNYLSRHAVFETVQEQTSQSWHQLTQSWQGETVNAITETANQLNYYGFGLFLFSILMLFRLTRLWRDFRKLTDLLHEATHYRQSGKLVIKISAACHIPFSIRLWKKAYIVLPLSLLSSAQHCKIALAHEGQHHRNGDCLWVYWIEVIRLIFFGNPGVSKWHNLLAELQEFSCDETVLGLQKFSAHEYGHCLFKVVQTVSHYTHLSQQPLACTVGMALGSEENILIKRRIHMLSQYPFTTETSVLAGVLFISTALFFPAYTAYAAMGSLATVNQKTADLSAINPAMQTIANREIATALKQYHAKSGVIAITDATNGNIIAFAEAGQVDKQSWKSRVFSAGSLIKPFIAAAAMEAGTTTPSKKYHCPAPYVVDGKVFKDVAINHQPVSLTKIMMHSLNTCMIKVAEETGITPIRQQLDTFGFDTHSWWEKRDSDRLALAKASVGENIPVTVATLSHAYTILANQGQEKNASIVSKKTANAITTMLENVVQTGTGRQAAISGMSVAGKTGTVKITEGKATGNLALFGGYLSADTNRYVMIVILEDGYTQKQGKLFTSGGELAAPVFQKTALALNFHKH